MIRYLQGRTFVGCDTVLEPAVRGVKAAVLCRQPATLLILNDDEIWHAGDVQEELTRVQAVCPEHEQEEQRRMAEWSSDDQYVVVKLPA